QTLHLQSLVALHAGAYICTGAASGTIQSRNSDCELVSGHTGHILHLHIRRSLGSLVSSHGNRTDYSMRTNVGTEVTLDTVVRIPYGNIHSDAALLVCGRTGRCGTVYVILESRYRQSI